MPQHVNQTSFKRGVDPRTGNPAMNATELKTRQQEYYQKHKAKTLRKTWERQIRANGWTPEQYNAALTEQGGVCFICLGKDKRRLSADHCHKTGKRRHLLCNRCNKLLGLIEQNPDLIRRMEDYYAQ